MLLVEMRCVKIQIVVISDMWPIEIFTSHARFFFYLSLENIAVAWTGSYFCCTVKTEQQEQALYPRGALGQKQLL